MMYKKGFTFIEAILAISLVSVATLFRTEFEAEQAQFEKANSFGKDLAKVLGGIDKRVLHDGRVEQDINKTTGVVTNGNWSANWGSNSAVIDQMLKDELIAYGNSVCGDSSTGWRPKLAENNEKALIDCNIFAGGIPFKFEIRGERIALDASNPQIIREWNYKIYHSNDTDFVDNFKYYSEIIKSAKLNDTIRMTGSHDIVLINRAVSPEVELNGLSECYIEKSNCAILFRYKNSNTATSTSETHIRVDGSVGMINDLTFKTTAGQPEKCFKSDKTEVSCGFDYDISSGSVDLYTNDINATTFHLLHEQLPRGATPVKVLCDEGGVQDAQVCGISVVEESGSVIAKAYFDRLYATEIYLNKFETDSAIVIRQTLDSSKSSEYNNKMEFSRTGLTYSDSTHGEQKIEFGSDLIMDAVSSSLNIDSSDLNVDSDGILTVSSDAATGTVDIQSSNGVEVYNGSGVSRGKVLTQVEAIQGVRVISMNIVDSGVATSKISCPLVNGKKPKTEAITHPAYGHQTNITSRGDSCDVTSPDFVRFNVNTPKIRLWRNAWNGGGEITNGDWTSADNITAESTYNMTLKCDPQRDTAVSYQVDESASSWTPRFWFWGGSKSEELSGGSSVPMTVIQYCDYSKDL